MNKIIIISALLAVSFNLFGQQAIQPLSPVYTEEHCALAEELMLSFAPKKQDLSINHDADEAWKNWAVIENYTYGKDRGNLPMIADLDALHPYFKEKIIKLLSMCAQKGIDLAIVETFRTHSKQDEYRSMGKAYTRSSGGRSKHQYGLAIDVVPMVKGEPQWDNKNLWKKVGIIGEQLGLKWGGRWKSLYDPGHFEWTGGISANQLANGSFPPIPKPDKYPCLNEDLERLTQAWKAWEIEQSTVSRARTEGTSSGMN
jgi:hypothetical protein